MLLINNDMQSNAPKAESLCNILYLYLCGDAWGGQLKPLYLNEIGVAASQSFTCSLFSPRVAQIFSFHCCGVLYCSFLYAFVFVRFLAYPALPVALVCPLVIAPFELMQPFTLLSCSTDLVVKVINKNQQKET